MNDRQRLLLWILLGAVFLTALIALTVVFRTELREVVVLPLQAWLRAVRQSWKGLDSEFRWGIYIVLVGLMIFLALPAPTRSLERGQPITVEKTEGRLAFWRSELRVLLGRGYMNRFTLFELRRLALEVVGFRQQLTEEEAEDWLLERLEARDAQVPEALRFLVDAGALAPTAVQPSPKKGILAFLRSLIEPEPPRVVPARVLTAAHVESMIQYLEKLLEVSDEDHHNP